jgi:hypothetical protein
MSARLRTRSQEKPFGPVPAQDDGPIRPTQVVSRKVSRPGSGSRVLLNKTCKTRAGGSGATFFRH